LPQNRPCARARPGYPGTPLGRVPKKVNRTRALQAAEKLIPGRSKRQGTTLVVP
jgi:hypothetical protein